MKKFVLLFLLLFAFSSTVFAADTASNTIEPRSSYVFVSASASISASAYEGTCSLTDKGDGSITLTLQKKLTSNNSWLPVSGESGTKTFTDKSLVGYTRSKTLSSGTYRCKAYCKATVGSYSDTKTVFSPELKIN